MIVLLLTLLLRLSRRPRSLLVSLSQRLSAHLSVAANGEYYSIYVIVVAVAAGRW